MDAKKMIEELVIRGVKMTEIQRHLGCSLVTVYAWKHYGAEPNPFFKRKLVELFESRIGHESRN